MIKINMFSSADKVKGQGVGSAYLELIKMLKKRFPNDFEIGINRFDRADISHFHTVNPNYYLATFFKKQRGVTIGYVHFLPETLKGSLQMPWLFQKIFNKYLVSFYRRMDQLVVVNPAFIPKLAKIGIPSERVTYIPNFVNTSVFHEVDGEEKRALREKYGFRPDDFIVLGAGQIQKRKGIDDFIQLAKDNPTIQFIWAGGFSFGKMTDGYEGYKKIYQNPPANLHFTGIIERAELAKYYNFSDVFLLPSYNELFPMSILEGFNCGTAILLRDLDLYHAIIEGDYVAAKDRTEMQEQLYRLKDEPAYLAQYQKRSRVAAQRYSEENVAAIWYDYYTSLIK